MNSRYSTAEIIGSVSGLKGEDSEYYGDRVVGVSVEEVNGVPLAKLEVRELKKNESFEIEIELAELVAAISLATFNAEKEK